MTVIDGFVGGTDFVMPDEFSFPEYQPFDKIADPPLEGSDKRRPFLLSYNHGGTDYEGYPYFYHFCALVRILFFFLMEPDP